MFSFPFWFTSHIYFPGVLHPVRMCTTTYFTRSPQIQKSILTIGEYTYKYHIDFCFLVPSCQNIFLPTNGKLIRQIWNPIKDAKGCYDLARRKRQKSTKTDRKTAKTTPISKINRRKQLRTSLRTMGLSVEAKNRPYSPMKKHRRNTSSGSSSISEKSTRK